MLEISLPMLLAHILCYDVWFYVTHRLLHTKQLWWIHRKHHEKRVPIYTDVFYGHWLETVIQDIGVIFPWPFVPTTFGTFLVASAIVGLRGILRHDARSNPWIGNHHMLHHELFTVNYGEYWIDRMLGTQCKQPERIVHGLFRI